MEAKKRPSYTATEEQKKITASVRAQLRKAIADSAGGQVVGVDTKYVGDHRQVRAARQDREPTTLLFAGNPYAQIRFAGASVKGEPVSHERLRKAFSSVKDNLDGGVQVGDTLHLILEPTLDGMVVRFGFTGLTL